MVGREIRDRKLVWRSRHDGRSRPDGERRGQGGLFRADFRRSPQPAPEQLAERGEAQIRLRFPAGLRDQRADHRIQLALPRRGESPVGGRNSEQLQSQHAEQRDGGADHEPADRVFDAGQVGRDQCRLGEPLRAVPPAAAFQVFREQRDHFEQRHRRHAGSRDRRREQRLGV